MNAKILDEIIWALAAFAAMPVALVHHGPLGPAYVVRIAWGDGHPAVAVAAAAGWVAIIIAGILLILHGV